MSTEQLPLLVDGKPCRQFWFTGTEHAPPHINMKEINYFDGLIFFRYGYFLVYCTAGTDEGTAYVPFPAEWLDENLCITWGELKRRLTEDHPDDGLISGVTIFQKEPQLPDHSVIRFKQKPDGNRQFISFPYNQLWQKSLDLYLKQYE